MGKFRYLTSCVDSPGLYGMSYAQAGDAIQRMQESAKAITRDTFLKRVDPEDRVQIEGHLGYAKHPGWGLTAKQDYHLSYYRGRFCGRSCYFMVHSLIEYIFVEEPYGVA